MGTFFYVMAIMGCADGSAQCSEARVEQVRYTTIEQCQAAMPGVLQRNTDIDFPVVTAACRKNGAQMAQASREKARS